MENLYFVFHILTYFWIFWDLLFTSLRFHLQIQAPSEILMDIRGTAGGLRERLPSEGTASRASWKPPPRAWLAPEGHGWTSGSRRIPVKPFVFPAAWWEDHIPPQPIRHLLWTCPDPSTGRQRMLVEPLTTQIHDLSCMGRLRKIITD